MGVAEGHPSPTAEEKQAFATGFSQSFAGFEGGLVTGTYDTSWNLNPGGCINVVVTGNSFAVTYNNCNFGGVIITGTITMNYSDLGGGAFDLSFGSNLTITLNSVPYVFQMSFTMSFDGASSFSYSGTVTINGNQYDIEEFSGELS